MLFIVRLAALMLPVCFLTLSLESYAFLMVAVGRVPCDKPTQAKKGLLLLAGMAVMVMEANFGSA